MEVPISYHLIRSARRSLSIEIDGSLWVRVRAPSHMPVSIIEAHIERKRHWIEKHMYSLPRQGDTGTISKLDPKDIENMKRALHPYIITRVHDLWIQTDLPAYTSIRVTRSEHRWGSCSGTNRLCFSYRLAHYLPWAWSLSGWDPHRDDEEGSRFIDAIIIHELAHLREKHHKKSFWDLVYQLMPEYEHVIRWGKIARAR